MVCYPIKEAREETFKSNSKLNLIAIARTVLNQYMQLLFLTVLSTVALIYSLGFGQSLIARLVMGVTVNSYGSIYVSKWLLCNFNIYEVFKVRKFRS